MLQNIFTFYHHRWHNAISLSLVKIRSHHKCHVFTSSETLMKRALLAKQHFWAGNTKQQQMKSFRSVPENISALFSLVNVNRFRCLWLMGEINATDQVTVINPHSFIPCFLYGYTSCFRPSEETGIDTGSYRMFQSRTDSIDIAGNVTCVLFAEGADRNVFIIWHVSMIPEETINSIKSKLFLVDRNNAPSQMFFSHIVSSYQCFKLGPQLLSY